ncbi:MAG: ZIP family metal transporter [Acidobacteria bacterium]|nr:ZIP family metal transporter [Acidobacteriota bacterium]
MQIHWIALALGLVAAAANVCGGLVVVRWRARPEYLKYFVALGAGFMLAASLLEMLPESHKRIGSQAGLWLLVGYLLMHFFEHTLSAHFHFGEEIHTTEVAHWHRGQVILVGLMAHSFVDGMSIATGFLVSPWLGWVIFGAVFLHKMPEGFAISSVMLASGRRAQYALTAAGLLGAATLAGVLVMMPLHAEVPYTLPISAGVTLYVAASDLIPEVNSEPGIRMALVVFVGVVFMLSLKKLFS